LSSFIYQFSQAISPVLVPGKNSFICSMHPKKVRASSTFFSPCQDNSKDTEIGPFLDQFSAQEIIQQKIKTIQKHRAIKKQFFVVNN
jgi:hypothetical protein